MAARTNWKKKCEEVSQQMMKREYELQQQIREEQNIAQRMEAEVRKGRELLLKVEQAVSFYMMARSQLAITMGNAHAYADPNSPPSPQRM